MCAEVRRSDPVEDCPPTSVLLVRKMKFLAKYSLCIQGDSGVPLIRDQAVNGVSQPGESSNPASVLFFKPGGADSLALRI
jgi:hypothetical protein